MTAIATPRGRLLLAPAGLLLLVTANASLNRQELSPAVAIALTAGLALWVLDTWRDGDLPDTRAIRRRQSLQVTSVRWPILALSLVAAMATWVWSSDNTFRPIGVACWAVSIVLWIASWWPARRKSSATAGLTRAARGPSPETLTVVILLVAVVAVGAFFRFHRIDATPLDPTSDHAEKLFDVAEVLDGARPIFFERNTGREPAQFYLTAGLIRVFDWPTNFTTLKMGTALIGTLAIPLVYLLAAELAGRTVGLMAAALFAIGTWPVEISRAGLRFPYALLAAAAVLWLLLRWMRTRDRRDALLCGLCLGIGLYGYSPFRVVVLAVCLGLVIALVTSPENRSRGQVVTDGLLMGATAGIVFVPLGRYALEHPAMFWSRTGGRITGDGGEGLMGTLVSQAPVFLENNWNAALGFNWRGDTTGVNAVRLAPMLDTITGALLLAGLVTILTHIVRRHDARAGLIVGAIPILLLSSTLAVAFPWENPSVNREGPLAPIVFLIAALPLAVLARRLRQGLGSPRGTLAGVPVIATLLVLAAAMNFVQYFHDFDRQTRAGVPNTTEIAMAIRGAAVVGITPENAYVIDVPHWLDTRNIGIALGDIDWAATHTIRPGESLPQRATSGPMLLILNSHDTVGLAKAQLTYPGGHVTRYPADVPSQGFVAFWVPAAEADGS